MTRSPSVPRIAAGDMVQHMDGRQGRVEAADLFVGSLPAARVKWFRGGPEEIVLLGYIWSTRMEENWD